MTAVLLLAFSVLPGPDSPDACARARFYLENRHVRASFLDSAAGLLQGIRARDGNNETALALLARVRLAQGDQSAGRARRLACYRQALAIADTLRRLDDANPEGHLWWAAARGLIGQELGMMNSLWMLPSIKRELGRALEVDSACPWVYTGLGSLYRRLPAVAGGNRARSRSFLENGLARFPNITDARLELARLDIDEHRWTEARQELRTLVATRDPMDPASFILSDLPQARKLLKQIGD